MYDPPRPIVLTFCVDAADLGCDVKTGGLIVIVVDDVTVRWATGLKLAGLGGMKKGESSGSGSCEDECAPSSGEGETGATAVNSSLSGAGESVACLVGGRGDGLSGRSYWLASLALREGEAGMLKLLDGLAKGLEGRSEEWLIWLGRRTNGLVFSGDKLPAFVGESVAFCLVGDGKVAGEPLFWRRKGD